MARDHPDLEHFVVGHVAQEGDESGYARRLRDLVAEQGMQGRVHFLGNVTEEEKVDLLQGAEVFVHTPVTSSDGGFRSEEHTSELQSRRNLVCRLLLY